ncbi:ATP-binding protein [Streptomyces sp. rh34]|uniref:ATP-binding protein n=1 Tax=Streptomyces sp. rh34 TaxID=2034272 RepID=UPI000BEFD0C9|nr:ATP-binding protein [Streptomyces sp. rh34]
MTCLHLPPVPASVGTARKWAAPLLPADIRDPVGLVVSELVTNAVAADEAAGAMDDIEVELTIDPAGLHVALAVTDASARPLPPSPDAVPADGDGGRGLLLLDALAYDHGWARRVTGKCVWALFRRATPERRWAISAPVRLECADA